MGQVIGQMPDTLGEMIEEKYRVLRWSSEVISRVDKSIREDNRFLMAYDDEKIAQKIENWIGSNMPKVDATLKKFPNATDDAKGQLHDALKKLREDMQNKIGKDYNSAYSNIKKFNKRVDELGKAQNKLHIEIQQISEDGDIKKFQKKLGPLRAKVFDNLRKGEKMIFEEKRLKKEFVGKIYDVDHEYMAEIPKKIDKITREFEKNMLK